jgi:polysaccharide pyruvyl transferase WcaK-like protein
VKIVVYGFYHHQNIGDDLFAKAFQKLFPQYHFVFTDTLSVAVIQDASAIFIGGGSFLFAPLNIPSEDFPVLKTKKLLYIGVGIEDFIHPMHLELMAQAELIAIRNPQQLKRMLDINSKTIYLPDLVYSMEIEKTKHKHSKSVLVLNNFLVIPTWQDPYWQHISWSYFKSEFGQFLDELLDQGYDVKFLPMSYNVESSDLHASIEILNSMKHRDANYLISPASYDIDFIINTLSQFEMIITQRFHGTVLSELYGIPYVCIHHHDKLRRSMERGQFVSYFALSKENLRHNFLEAQQLTLTDPLINIDVFDELKLKVNRILGGDS